MSSHGKRKKMQNNVSVLKAIEKIRLPFMILTHSVAKKSRKESENV